MQLLPTCTHAPATTTHITSQSTCPQTHPAQAHSLSPVSPSAATTTRPQHQQKHARPVQARCVEFMAWHRKQAQISLGTVPVQPAWQVPAPHNHMCTEPHPSRFGAPKHIPIPTSAPITQLLTRAITEHTPACCAVAHQTRNTGSSPAPSLEHHDQNPLPLAIKLPAR